MQINDTDNVQPHVYFSYISLKLII